VIAVDELAEAAAKRAQLDDFGGDSWREGLSILVDALETFPGVQESGCRFFYGMVVDALWNRLRVVDHAKRHPAVRRERIERPLVILGMPRTGTTVASYLLDQDPKRRSLLHWEARDSVPPATTETLRSDPRCLARKAALDQAARAIEAAGQGFSHWEDADGPTECIFIQNQDFKALVWDAWMPDARYSDWLLGADLTSAYAYHQLVLQILQSQAPGTWSLKMPSHAVHIDALLATYPDVRIVWAHRDPFRATASLCSIQVQPKAMTLGSALDPRSIAPIAISQMRAHVSRALRARERIGAQRFFDLHYADLMRDPIGEMRRLYAWAGDELAPEVEQRMKDWLARNPQDRFGARPYSFEQFGLTRRQLEPVFAEYLATFAIELEPIKEGV
jgi:sulfotransferase family protein